MDSKEWPDHWVSIRRPVGKNIIYSEAFNSDHQILILEKADKIIQDNNIKLIIVDSLTAHFRSEYLGREMLAERQQKINSHMHRLVRLARAFNAVAVVTNQVMSKPDAFFASGVEPVGGQHRRTYLAYQNLLEASDWWAGENCTPCLKSILARG